MTERTHLSYQTFISPPIPIATDQLVPNGDQRSFSPLTTTLISGTNDAVLVDPPMTTTQTQAVGDWVESSGKELTHIYLTHGHGDHWFGTGPLLERFPTARAVALPGTIAMMAVHASAAVRDAIWDAQFPGQIPDVPVHPEPLTEAGFSLEGEALIGVDLGHTDTDDTTVLSVPSLGLVVAGDVIYNNVHQYLREAAGDGIERWLRAIAEVEGLDPTSVVAGHKDASRTDDPRIIEDTRQYLLDARDLLGRSASALDFFEQMLRRHPGRLNPGALWSGALALFS
jgi:glyoxylase-like metal-dependent hydrolase (beta-lactamase superfamily II)